MLLLRKIPESSSFNFIKNRVNRYDRTPPCSLVLAITQCSQYFHDVQITNLQPGTTYYYQIPGGNGTTGSDLLSFTTARPASDKSEFSVAVLNDMGYTFAAGTWQTLVEAAAADDTAFVWHGGDISYADDWVYALQPCAPYNASLAPQYQPRCYNGSGSTLPYNIIDDPNYYIPVPAGEGPTQGGPQGGDMATIYETNWDLWQNWMSPITKKLVYMVLPGNHEAACTESDWGVENQVTAILDDGLTAGSSSPVSNLSYWSCPPSQRYAIFIRYSLMSSFLITGA